MHGFREEDLNISSSSSRRCSSRNSYDCSNDIVVLLPLKAVRVCSIWQHRDGLSTVVAVTIADKEIKICDAGSRSMDCSCETFLRLVFLLLWLWVFFLMDFFFLSGGYPCELYFYCSSKCVYLDNVSQQEISKNCVCSESMLYVD